MAERVQIADPPPWLTVNRDGSVEVDCFDATDAVAQRRVVVGQLWRDGWRPIVELCSTIISENRLGPFAKDSDTSRKAALDAYPRQGSQRARIIGSLSYAGDATRDDLMARTGLGHSSVGPRVKELIEGGWVEETEHTRKTSRGSDATLLTLTSKARTELGRQRHAEGL